MLPTSKAELTGIRKFSDEERDFWKSGSWHWQMKVNESMIYNPFPGLTYFFGDNILGLLTLPVYHGITRDCWSFGAICPLYLISSIAEH